MAKSAPAAHLRTKYAVSDSRSGDRGCRSGNAATPTQKSPEARIRRTRSAAYSRPSGRATHPPLGHGAEGGWARPRRAAPPPQLPLLSLRLGGHELERERLATRSQQVTDSRGAVQKAGWHASRLCGPACPGVRLVSRS